MIKDTAIAWKTKVDFIDLRNTFGMIAGASQGTGGAVVAAHSVAASELTDVQAGADGDEIYHLYRLPWDFDRGQDFRWRVIYSHSSTDADTPTFTFDYMGRAEGEAIADITSHEATTWSGAVSTTANALGLTDWVSTNSASYLASTDYCMLCRLTTTYLGGASANEIEMFGIEIEYTVNATSTDGRRHTTEFEPVG